MNTATIVAFAVLFVVAASAQQNQNQNQNQHGQGQNQGNNQNQNQNCPNFQPKQNMDSNRMAGQWTASSHLEQGLQFPNIKCLKTNVQVNSNNGQLNTNVQYQTQNNQQKNKNEVGTPIDGQRAKLSFQSADDENDDAEITTILATDYDNYAVWATCFNRQNQQGYNVVVTSRQANGNLSQQHQQQAQQALRANNINGQLQQMDQQNC